MQRYYEKELRNNQQLWEIKDLETRIAKALLMTILYLKSKKGDNYYNTYNEDDQTTAKHLSLAKFISSLYHKDKQYNGPKPTDEVPYIQSKEWADELKRREELLQA